jgi:hypothetical protein
MSKDNRRVTSMPNKKKERILASISSRPETMDTRYFRMMELLILSVL